MTIYDDPNREAVGLEPAWVEGGGGSEVQEPEAAPRGTVELDDMTKDELLEHARTLGVSPANAAMTKDELRAGIDAKEAGQ
jgi:hypothetical protein